MQGQGLSEAKQWAGDKVLPPEDYAFLAASQELATEEAEEAKATLALANRTLEEANREATVRMDSANQRLRIGSLILLGTIALAVISGGTAVQINASAKARQAEADQQLSEAQSATVQANTDKQVAEQDKEDAQAGLQDAKVESERIRRQSASQIAEADQQVEQASVQAQRAQEQRQVAQSATQQAEQEQQLAQQKADEAQEKADEAKEQVGYARQAEEDARKEQELIQAGIRLERLGTALLRRPETQMSSLDTLLDALELGQELNQLLVASTQEKTVISTKNYPAISPLLALRTVV